MTNYFHNIFTSTRSLEDSEIIGAMEPRLTPEMNRCLEMRISEEEVRKTIFQMQPAKAPGPYGMNPFFYQWYWHIMGMDVTKAIMNFFASGRLLKQTSKYEHLTVERAMRGSKGDQCEITPLHGGASTSNSNSHSLWLKVWNADVPRKVKIQLRHGPHDLLGIVGKEKYEVMAREV
ncbi:hypothetical protein FF1_014881 [Malus domestica]